MKKITKLLLVTLITLALAALASFAFSASAYTYGDLTYKIYDYVEISGCEKSVTSVVIPTTIDGYPVKAIGDHAFKDCTSLTNIEIPSSVHIIYNNAFEGCTSLTNIEIPSSVYTIGNNAFEGCISLTNIEIPSSVKSIDGSVFDGCTGLTNISVHDDNNYYSSESGVLFDKNKTKIVRYPSGKPNTEYIISESVTSVGKYAFSDCKNLTSIEIPKSVTTIEVGALKGCTFLEEMTIPFVGTSREKNGTYDAVFGYIFGRASSSSSSTTEQYCSSSSSYYYYIPSSLRKITITDQTDIPYGAFYNCSFLTEINLPDNVMSIGGSAFYNCSSLAEIIIPDSVTSIGSSAFRGCTGLTSLEIPDDVTSIGASAFSGCTSLTDITIPDSVTSIGSSAFYNCSSLKNIEIPDSITSIGSSAFYNCSSLKNIEIPDSVTSIGNEAFYNCESLTDVTIGNSVKSIGSSAFYNCTSLTEITIPDSVTSIGDSAFRGCTSLEEMTIPFVGLTRNSVKHDAVFGAIFGDTSYSASGTTEQYYSSSSSYYYYIPSSLRKVTITDEANIPYGAFYNCSFLTEITLLDNVMSIGDSAFCNCSSLTEIIIPDSVTSIGDSAFCNCSSLTEIIIPDSVTSMRIYAFYNCSSLTEIIIPDSVTSISGYVFRGCSSLTSIEIPDRVTSIGAGAFWGCTSLKNIEIPDSVTSIFGAAFYDCTSLAEIIIPDSVTSIGDSAFYNCSSLTEITIPDSVTSIGDSAFRGCISLEEMTLPFVGTSREKNGTYNAVFGYIFGHTSSSSSDTKMQVFSSGNSSYYYYIPSSLRKITITDQTDIPYGAFYNCSFLTEINLPDNVMSIGGRAFYNCSSLTEITIPDSVTSIGYATFYKCTRLTGINLPDNVESIGSEAFYMCSGITSITLPKTIKSIHSSSFDNCTKLTDVYYNGPRADYLQVTDTSDFKNKKIHYHDFGSCGSLSIWEFTFDEQLIIDGEGTVETTGYDIYSDIIDSIHIGARIEDVSTTDYSMCTLNEAFSVDEENTDYIAVDGILYSNNGKEIIAVPAGIESDYVISENVTTIGKNAFNGIGLNSVVIPTNVVAINENAFAGCDKLSSVIYEGTEEEWNKINIASGNEAVTEKVVFRKYNVKYNLNGGRGSIASQTKILDEALTISSAIPVREGHIFKGWSDTATGAPMFTSGDTYVSNESITLYAVWEIEIYRIIYNANGGSGAPTEQTKTYDEDFFLSEVIPVRNGYTFEGWARSADGDVEYAAGDIFWENENTELFAVWSINLYYVNYDANGGEGLMLNSTHEYNVEKELSINTYTRTGYVFKGWATTKDGDVEFFDSQSVINLCEENGKEFYLYAVWSANNYTVTYNANSGKGTMTKSAHKYDVEKTLSKNKFTKTGYNFQGWSTSPDGSVEYTDEQAVINLVSEPKGNITLYAVWAIDVANAYSVTYVANGGGDMPEAQLKIFDEPLTLSKIVPTRFGYDFLGWAIEPNGNTVYNPGDIYTDNNSLTLYAVWNAHIYTIKYDANGGDGVPENQTKTHDITLILSSTVPEKEGFKFVGWSKENDITAEYLPGSSFTENGAITLYAVWEIKTYKITYDSNGGSGSPGEQVKTYGVDLALSEVIPVREGHIFKGWSDTLNGTPVYSGNQLYTENKDITLYAVWETETYTVIYDANSGDVAPENQFKTYGISLKLSEFIPTKDKHKFLGWSESVSGEVKYLPGSMYYENKDITLYAVWERIVIKYDVNNDDVFDYTDIKIVIDTIAGIDTTKYDALKADFNGDNKITLYDLNQLMIYLRNQNADL